MLCVHNLSIAFRRYVGIARQARLVCLREVSLVAAPGEVLAIIGASGAGKSLLAHAVVGLLPGNAEAEGTLTFEGDVLTPARQAALRGGQIALVPQSIAFLDPLTRVERQLQFAARRAGLPSAALRRSVTHNLERFGLDGSVGRAFPHQLSGGMARRVLLAIATVGDPRLVIADEPTTGLDENNSSAVLTQLREMADRDKTVLLITHDIRAALRVADRVVVIRDGVTVDNAPAGAFHGEGDALLNAYTRALWRALPENDFHAAVAEVELHTPC